MMCEVSEDEEYEESDPYDYKKKDVFRVLGKRLQEFKKDDALCDVTLKVNDKKFKAHRVILAATSPFFYAMFTNEMKESKQEEIELFDLDSSTFEQLLDFIYTGKIKINESNAKELFLAAGFFQFDDIQQNCARCLNICVRKDTFVEMFQFAKCYHIKELLQGCDYFINHHFQELIKLEDFQNFNKEMVVDILSRHHLYVKSEKEILEAALTWVNRDVENRLVDAPELIRLARLPQLPRTYLLEFAAKEDPILNFPACRALLDAALEYQVNPESRSKNQIFESASRPQTQKKDVVLLGYKDDSDDVVFQEVGCSSYSSYSKGYRPPEKFRNEAVIIEHAGCIYSIGGYVAKEGLPRSRKRSKKCRNSNPDLVQPCDCESCTKENDRIEAFVYKPLEKHDPYRSVDKFDPKNNVWERVAPMLHYRRYSAAASYEGRLYVFGGEDIEERALDTAEMYDPETNQWTEIASMNVARIKHAAVVCLGMIYVIGGERRSPSEPTCLQHKNCKKFMFKVKNKKEEIIDPYILLVEIFNIETGQWSYGVPILQGLRGLSAASINEKIFILGITLADEKSGKYSSEYYDPLSNSWTIAAPSDKTYRTPFKDGKRRQLIACSELYAFCDGVKKETYCFASNQWECEDSYWFLTEKPKCEVNHEYYVAIGN